MRTKEEAKTQWCPHVRITYGREKLITNRGDYVTNPGDDLKKLCMCLGDDCGAWRNNPTSGKGYCSLGDKPERYIRVERSAPEKKAPASESKGSPDTGCGYPF